MTRDHGAETGLELSVEEPLDLAKGFLALGSAVRLH
jgi:hypothetical protein